MLEELVTKYDLPVDAIPEEMFDFLKVVSMGAKKYSMNNWLEKDGKNSSEQKMHDSMFHHLAQSLASVNNGIGMQSGRFDSESTEDHLLHLACRALMVYTRRQRNIIHPEDLK